MHHGVVTVPKGTPLTHQAPDGTICPERYWVADHKPVINLVGKFKWVMIWPDVVLHGLEVTKNCVDFTELTIIATHWDNPVTNPVKIEFTPKMQRRLLANLLHIIGMGKRKFLKLFF